MAHIAIFLLCRKLTNVRKMKSLILATLPQPKSAHLEQLRFHRWVRLFVRFSWNLSPKSVRFSIVLGYEFNLFPNFGFFVFLGINRWGLRWPFSRSSYPRRRWLTPAPCTWPCPSRMLRVHPCWCSLRVLPHTLPLCSRWRHITGFRRVAQCVFLRIRQDVVSFWWTFWRVTFCLWHFVV